MLRDASYRDLAYIHPPTKLCRMYDGHDAGVDECSSHTFLLRTHSKSVQSIALMIDNMLASLQASQIYHILYLFMLALMSANVMADRRDG